jgi:hypothetical protein
LLAPCQPCQFADGAGLGCSDQRQKCADGMSVDDSIYQQMMFLIIEPQSPRQGQRGCEGVIH